MNRRAFFKTVATGTIAGIALVSSSPLKEISAAFKGGLVQLILSDRLLQGTPQGLVQESRDNGQTWQTLINFGSECAVMALAERGGSLYARLAFQKFTFFLKSADGRVWHTV